MDPNLDLKELRQHMLAISRMRDLVAGKHKWKKNRPSHLLVNPHCMNRSGDTSSICVGFSHLLFFPFLCRCTLEFWLAHSELLDGKNPNSCALRKHVQCGQSHLLSWNSGCGEPHQ